MTLWYNNVVLFRIAQKDVEVLFGF
jgi:hypothetical protein